MACGRFAEVPAFNTNANVDSVALAAAGRGDLDTVRLICDRFGEVPAFKANVDSVAIAAALPEPLPPRRRRWSAPGV